MKGKLVFRIFEIAYNEIFLEFTLSIISSILNSNIYDQNLYKDKQALLTDL